MLRALSSVVLAFSSAWLAAAGISAAESSTDELLRQLKSPDPEVKVQAMDALAEGGSAAKAAVPQLIELLQSGDQEIAWHAARTLGSLGPDASSAVPSLTKALSHGDPQVRAYAAFALGRIGKAALPAVTTLVERAFEDEELVRRACLRALLLLDPPADQVRPLVLKILEQGDPKTIVPALQTLAREGERVVPRLIEALDHAEARYWACVALAEIGPAAAAAVPRLSEILKDENPEVRLHSLVALGEIGEAAQPAVPAIVAALEKDPFPPVQHAAVFALGKLKATSANAVLGKSLESDDALLRILSAWALARTNPADRQVVQRAVREVLGAFKSQDVHVRRAAARAVADFDADPELVGPALVEVLRDKDPAVVANAIDALAGLGPKALRNIGRALSTPELRFYAVRLVARLGREAESAVPELIEVVKKPPQTDEDVEFVREAQFALGAVGPGAASAVPALIESLKSAHEEIAASAAFALARIGPAARAAVPALRENLRKDDFLVKLSSLRALLQIQPAEPRLTAVAAPLLIQALGNERDMIRAEAASAIGEMGAAGKRAIPDLKKLLTDPSEMVRQAATSALEKLEG